MPVLESTDHVSPRSVLRHRPLDEASKRSVITTAARPIAQRASLVRPMPADDDLVGEWRRGDANEVSDSPASQRVTGPHALRVRRGKTNRSAQKTTIPQSATHRPRHLRAHPLLFLGLGMLAMLVLWQILTAGLNWWNDAMDSIHYGFPRTFQMDAVVGHNDSVNNPSHFLAINLHGRIEIIEFPGGDSSHARIYLGPQLFGDDADKAPVTLKFVDINSDHQPDMFVFFQSSWIVFINAQDSFRTPTVQERQAAVQYLATHGQ